MTRRLRAPRGPDRPAGLGPSREGSMAAAVTRSDTWGDTDISCSATSDFVEQFATERGRDMFGGDGVDDRRQARELAHAGLTPWWRP